jgi:hypothetical protein
MCLYMDQLKLPNKGQTWGVAMGLIILAWALWYPLAFVFMWIAMGARRYEPPKKPTIPIIDMDTKASVRPNRSWKAFQNSHCRPTLLHCFHNCSL